MDRGHVLRRVVHVCAPVFLLYYAFPEEVMGLPRDMLVIIALIATLIFELFRLIADRPIVGMRSYERQQVSAAAWAAVGISATLLLAPLEVAAPVLFGMGLVDPLIGELRRRGSRLYPLLPAAMYMTIILALLWIGIGMSPMVVAVSTIATVVAIGIERISSPYVDDDFLMIVGPLTVLLLLL